MFHGAQIELQKHRKYDILLEPFQVHRHIFSSRHNNILSHVTAVFTLKSHEKKISTHRNTVKCIVCEKMFALNFSNESRSHLTSKQCAMHAKKK